MRLFRGRIETGRQPDGKTMWCDCWYAGDQTWLQLTRGQARALAKRLLDFANNKQAKARKVQS